MLPHCVCSTSENLSDPNVPMYSSLKTWVSTSAIERPGYMYICIQLHLLPSVSHLSHPIAFLSLSPSPSPSPHPHLTLPSPHSHLTCSSPSPQESEGSCVYQISASSGGKPVLLLLGGASGAAEEGQRHICLLEGHGTREGAWSELCLREGHPEVSFTHTLVL